MARHESARTRLARLGFEDLSGSAQLVAEAGEWLTPGVLERFAAAADPDAALVAVLRLVRAGVGIEQLMDDPDRSTTLVRTLGASTGLAEHALRHPEVLEVMASPPHPRAAAEYRSSMLDAVGAADGVPAGSASTAQAPMTTMPRDEAIAAMRVRYRMHLAEIAAWDLSLDEPVDAVQLITSALADLATSTIEASLAIARATASARFGDEDVAQTRFAVIGMGKMGARELNYLSDADVIWVHDAGDVDESRAATIATMLAQETSLGCTELALEPMLWEVDANLRPEGRSGALTRTLASHVAYYDRWAKSWEFQALLKARAIAGDVELGRAYEQQVGSLTWGSSRREGFVESVQRMRERVTENIPAGEVDRQLKLGPGGLRDIEFTTQLLQLVHGATDPSVRQRGTLPALEALADAGYIGRDDRAEFADDYRLLRVLEHRAQLARLTRTHLMPDDVAAQRALARAARLGSRDRLLAIWGEVRAGVRTLHERIFYRPLLGAVAALPEGGTQLTSEHAMARLEASGFSDPKGALAHIRELTQGVTRAAQIQRLLLPVLLEWLSEGADPDMGLIAFRRLSAALGTTPWFLRMLRDSPVAAERLMAVLSSSKLIGSLFERIPDAARWLESDDELSPRTRASLDDEVRAIVSRHAADGGAASKALRALRRREVLRAALASALQLTDVTETGLALSDIAQSVLGGAVRLHHDDERDGFEFAIMTMGRTGGREIGFGSDVDVMHVCRPIDDVDAVQRSQELVRRITDTLADPVLPMDLDAGLRPEGRNGPMVRTLESYRGYYSRWSEAWEAQALLRARPFAGTQSLLAEFVEIIDPLRYPQTFPVASVREVRRIKARVEAERLPRGADARRHLKLGTGSLSDVEWLVQLLQLLHAHDVEGLRTQGTLTALDALVDAEIFSDEDAAPLRAAWLLASAIRSALTLSQARTSDLLPSERDQLETVARLLGMRSGSASALEEEYLQVTRRARRVFERLFYA